MGCGAFKSRRSSAPNTSAWTLAGGKASMKLAEFRAINTLLGNLKTAISCAQNAFDFAKFAHCYLAEFQYRFNMRMTLPPSVCHLGGCTRFFRARAAAG